jgi:tricorn protease
VRLARDPAPSPDGRLIAFSWHGDLFVASSAGGDARRLTVHPAEDRSPVWSPDGTRLAFSSNRYGNSDIFTVGADGQDLTRVTWHSSSDTRPSWTPDGESILFASRRDAAFRAHAGLWTTPADGSRDPERYTRFAARAGALSSDGRLVFERGRTSWNRKNYRGSSNSNLWIEREPGEFVQLTDHDGHDDQASWCRIGGREQVCYRSDESGSFGAWAIDPDSGRRQQLFADPSDELLTGVRFGGGLMAFERLDRIVVADLGGGRAAPVWFQVPADSHARDRRTMTLTGSAEDLAMSPDGEQMAFVLRGEIFVAKAEKDAKEKTAARVTDSPGRDRRPAWLPEADGLVFASDRHGHYDLFLARARKGAPTAGEGLSRALAFDVERLTRDGLDDLEPVLSPDGSLVAFRRGRGDLWLLELDSRKERLLTPGWNLSSVSFSPDGQWLAFARDDDEFNGEVFIVPVDGSTEPVNVSRHPDDDGSPRWSRNGRALSYRAKRQGQDRRVALVTLREADARLSPEALESEWKAAAKAAGKSKKSKKGKDGDDEKKDDEPKVDSSVLIDFERLHERVNLLTAMPGGGQLALSPDGLTVAYSATALDGKTDVWSIRWDGEKRSRLSKGGASPSSLAFSADGKNLTYLSSGKVKRLPAQGGSADTLGFRARFVVDVAAERRQIFHEIWRTLGRDYYDPAMHGVDWEAMRALYAPLAEAAVTDAEFKDVVSRMLGELNSSHLGYWGGGSGGGETESESTGELGLRLAPSDADGGRLVTAVMVDGPCDGDDVGIEVGDRLLAIDDHRLSPTSRIAQHLAQRTGERVRLTIEGAARSRRSRDGGSLRSGGATREVVVQPISTGALGGLLYEEWIRERRALTEELAGGRIGFVHVRSMNTSSLERFEQELYSVAHGRDAIVIDVRDNGGGWTADYMLAILMVKRHATTVPRGGGPGYPQGRRPLYAWSKPVATLCNAGSFSNAEILSHAMKTLDRGPVVGETTGGGVISTGGTRLLDGSFLRLPFRGWWSDGTGLNMEGNGAVPDHPVALGPAEEAAGEDPQLARAVQLLLQDLPPADQPGG